MTHGNDHMTYEIMFVGRDARLLGTRIDGDLKTLTANSPREAAMAYSTLTGTNLRPDDVFWMDNEEDEVGYYRVVAAEDQTLTIERWT